MHNYIWGFHCSVIPLDFAKLVTLFNYKYGFENQPDLLRLSPHYDAVTMQATFEVVSKLPILATPTDKMEKYLETNGIKHVVFNNAGYNGPSHQSIFAALKAGQNYSPEVTNTLFGRWYSDGKLTHFNQRNFDNNHIVLAAVAFDLLPDQLLKYVDGAIEDGTEYYRRLIK